jgi:hypothetical protein
MTRKMGGRRREEERIRPTVWLFVAFCVGACVLTLYLVADFSDVETGPEVVADYEDHYEPERRSRRHHWSEPDPGGEAYYGHAADPRAVVDQRDPDAPDPQLDAMERWLGPRDGGVPMHFNPTYEVGEIAHIEGIALEPGTSCDVRVLPIETYSFSCLIRVTCDGLVLYPDPDQSAGYVECDVEDGQPMAAIDDGYTHADGDPTVSFDRRRLRVTVSDDGPGVPNFRAEIELRPRRM